MRKKLLEWLIFVVFKNFKELAPLLSSISFFFSSIIPVFVDCQIDGQSYLYLYTDFVCRETVGGQSVSVEVSEGEVYIDLPDNKYHVYAVVASVKVPKNTFTIKSRE